MTLNELGKTLNEMYSNAPKGEQVTMIYLFGIRYHNLIKEHGIKAVIEQSGIRSSYHTELAKALKIAKYVTVR